MEINIKAVSEQYRVPLRKADRSDRGNANDKIDTGPEMLLAAQNVSGVADKKFTGSTATEAEQYLKSVLGIKDVSPKSSEGYDVFVDFDTNSVGYWYSWDGTMGGIRNIDDKGNKGYKISKASSYGGFGVDTAKGQNTVAKKESSSPAFPDFGIKGKGYNKIALKMGGSKMPSKMKVEVTTYSDEKYELWFNPKPGLNTIKPEEFSLNSVSISKLQFGFEAGDYDFWVDNIGFAK